MAVKLAARPTGDGVEARASDYLSHGSKRSESKNQATFGCMVKVCGGGDADRSFAMRGTWDWIPGSTCDILRTCRQGADSYQETGAHFHAQAHISTQPPQTREDARFPRADEDQERRSRIEPPSRDWPQTCVGQRRLPRLTSAVLFEPETTTTRSGLDVPQHPPSSAFA